MFVFYVTMSVLKHIPSFWSRFKIYLLIYFAIKYFSYSSQTSIYAHWYVATSYDVADFYLYIRDRNNTLHYSKDISYNLRSLTIPINKDFKIATQNGAEICIQAKNSNNFARKFFDSQCQKVPSNFESWPKKLTVDKRRLSRKKVRYSFFGNSVLGLVSDSILITLCIFLGVCFRRLADLDIWVFFYLFFSEYFSQSGFPAYL